MEKYVDLRDFLTTEELKTKFKSQFDLVTYAIKLAENMIKTGRDTRVKIETQNRAMQILTEIASGKDIFDELPQEVQEAIVDKSLAAEAQQVHAESKKSQRSAKPPVSKKGRKILADSAK